MNKQERNEQIAKLVVAAQSGEAAALGALVREVQDDLFRFLLFLVGNRQLAQDLAQDALIKVLENISTLREPATFMGWLFRMAKNLYLDHVRSPKNSSHKPLEDLAALASESENLELMVVVENLLQQLQPEDRYGFLLVYLEGYSYAEAAEVLKISENAMRSRLHRARLEISGEKAGSDRLSVETGLAGKKTKVPG